MGEEKQSYAWRQELDKIRSQKPLRVSELIGTFNRREPVSEDETEAAVKQRRRASLNIQFDPSSILTENENKTTNEKWLKAQRRKSASSILSNNIENLKIQEQVGGETFIICHELSVLNKSLAGVYLFDFVGSSCSTAVERTPHNKEVVGSLPVRCWACFSFYPQ